MATSTAHHSIAQAHYACVDAFVSLLNATLAHAPEQCTLNVRAIQNTFDKYRLWSGNLGAMHSGQQWKISLDYRLRESSFYKVQVLRLLDHINNSIEAEVALATIDSTRAQADGNSDNQSDILEVDASETDDSPWEVSSDSEDGQAVKKDDRHFSAVSSASNPISEIHMIEFIVSCLWRLPIRRPAPLDRMKESATAKTSYYQPFDIMHVKNKFPSIDEGVANRLGKMISRRRQLLRYRKAHTDSLEGKHLQTRRRVIEFDEGHEGTEIAPSFVASTRHTHDTKATTLKLDAHDQVPTGPSNLYVPSISPSISSAGSEQDDSKIPIIIPNRPKGDSGDALEQFICPYCLTAQSIKTDYKWSNDLYQKARLSRPSTLPEKATLQTPREEASPDIKDLNDPFTPPLLEGMEAAQGTSWDYVTPKFQEARAAMYGSHTPDKKDPPLQEYVDGDMTVMNPYFQQRPLCGASIGAFQRGEHLPPVSLGGIILVDGEPYGLTVHHFLDVPSDDESDDEDEETNNPKIARSTDVDVNEQSVRNHGLQIKELGNPRQSGPDSPTRSSPEDKHFNSSDPIPVPGSRLFSDSDANEPSSESIMGEDDPIDTTGDIPGILPGEGKDIIVTQPAIDDVDEDFFPNEDDRDEDHLLSHRFGYVHASSGLRRWKRNGILHEIDWALIKVDPERLELYNVVQGGRRFHLESKPEDPPPLEEPVAYKHYTQDENEYPMEVVPEHLLGGLNVHCFGRTTGLQGGQIGPSMRSVRIYGRKTFSRAWHVTGGFGVGGDSGAWVIENLTGRVCGILHVWDHRNHLAYIMPMQIVLEDIKRTLGAKDVCFPSFKTGQAAQAVQVPSASSPTLNGMNAELHEKSAFERIWTGQGLGIGERESLDTEKGLDMRRI
ncbi:hypothetical protein BDV95DRAFT_598073 [Massariosphaeria phaeospora]|uniref:Uncharacterized protein n=1 Tax=Massariosphaeria phaeospora TaxID=100035 RepID=A0A7C8I3Z4_9PLEO|nr:hypothetical protein BDV95DRAFT_598073 [Massariosphaeria phaeospora]